VVEKKRHIAKTLTWRVVGTIDTMVIGYILTGDFKVGLSIGGIELFSKMILYYLHERVWYRSNFGVNEELHKDKGEDSIRPEESYDKT
jgi:uncharacterized membrane protein